ncbi:MAG: PEP-CTERM system TPR-repeat protein PrsT [Halioglobus sp.]
MKLSLPGFLVLLVGLLLPGCGEELTSEAHLNKAKAFLEQSDEASAIAELKYALKKDVKDGRARALLGQLYFQQGEYEDADKELSRALASGVEPTVVVPLLAQVLLGLGSYDRLDQLGLDGLDPKNRSIVQAAKALSMLHRNNMVVASEIMEMALQNKPNSPYAQVAAARLAMEKGAYDEARELLKPVFTESPKYAPAWNLLGDIESAQRHPKKAEEAYTKVIKLSGKIFDAQLNRAMMRIYQGNFKGAREDLTQLGQAYGPSRYHPGMYFAWGLVYLQARNMDAAVKSFEQASEYSDTYPQTLYYLAAIYLEKGLVEQSMINIYRFLGLVPGSVAGSKLAAKLELGQKNYAKAEQLLLPVASARPDDVETLNLLASALLAQGKSGEGVELLARVAELKPESTEAQARLGAGFLAAGSEDLGIETLRDILKKNPDYEQADILIVLNYLRHSEFAEAIAAAREYRDRHPQSATSYDLLGRAYMANGDKSNAKLAFSKALELRPGDPGAGNSLAELALQVNDYEAAREYYRLVLAQNPEHLQTSMKVVASYALEGNEEKMLESLQSTLVAFPRAMEPRLVKVRYYIGKGQLEDAIALFDELTEEQKDSVDALSTWAGIELAAGRYNQALATLGKLTERFPGVGQYHYMKARAYAGLGEMTQFTAELQRTIELDPDHFYAKIAFARLALLSNRRELFEENLAELRKVAPGDLDVMKLEVAEAQNNGDNKRAVELLEKIYLQEPTTENVTALAAQRESAGNVNGAIVQLQQWLAEHSADIKAREKLAEVYRKSNQPGGMSYQYREILKADPRHVIALNNLAWYLLDDEPKQSLSYAQQAQEISPDSSSILDTLAMAQLKNGNVTEARRAMNRAISKAPKSPELRFHDAQIMVAEGNTAGAVEALSALLQQRAPFPARQEAAAYLKKLTLGNG